MSNLKPLILINSFNCAAATKAIKHFQAQTAALSKALEDSNRAVEALKVQLVVK